MTPEDLIGRSLLGGEYVLQEVLGRGGMATVYRAYCHSLDTDVAVKVLAPRLAQDPGFRERFHDEARSLAPLHHPNLIEVHRYGEEGDLVFIAMRLVEGGTLKQLAQAMQAPLDIVTTARLISQVADALQMAHEDNLIHLDIKPANILLGRHDWPLWPLLADFGITQAVQREETQHGRERLAGTPLYMSPEQCVGGPIDGRSDEYSLAVTAFELLTGRVPFVAETTEMLLQRHIVEPPPRVREVNPAVPSPVEEVVLRGLAKSPDDRYPTIREFGAALSEAAERTRGVSLETKKALSGIAPNLIGTVALLLIGPLLLTLLPEGALLGSRLPFVWPFQFALGLMLAGLLWGIRWHVIGLLTRATSSVLDAVLLAGGPGTTDRNASNAKRVKPWRDAIVGSVEGLVSLGYLVVFYRLLAVPALTILATLIPGPIYQGITLAVALVVVVVAVGVVVSIYRSSGPVVAGLVLAAGWALTTALPAYDLAMVAGTTTVEMVRLVVGAVILVALVATRRSARPIVAQAAIAALGSLLAVAQPGANAEQVAAGRRHVGQLAEGVLDFGYLLLGYALLQAPLVATLRGPLGVLPAAILVTGAAALIWVFLVLRLHWIAGTPGATLGVVLGAPLLTSLPLFQPQTLGLDWPATVATWVVAVALILLVALIHGQVQAVGQRALGPILDRGLAGTHAAPDEAKADRRARALADLGGAFVDVILLVVGYWVVGLPAVATLSRASGRHDLGILLLFGVILAALVILAGPLRQALITLDETGGGSWGRRFAAVPLLAVGLAALLVGGCAAIPAMLTSPAAAGDLALAPSQTPVVLVDWQHYVPWTPTKDEATYAVSLSCSDGSTLGVFREAFRPPAVSAMPSGNVGTLGRTQTPCSDWVSTYFALRQKAGLPTQSSVSWDAVDVRAALQPDGSADVVETHRVLFTNGSYAHLLWPEATQGSQGTLTNVGVTENGTPYAANSAGTASSFHLDTTNGSAQLNWSFPSVASPAVHTYTIHYKIDGAIQNVEGGQQFAREVLLPNREGPVWQMTVEVTLPNTPASPAQLSSSGAPARDGLIDSRTAWFEANNVPPGNYLNVVVTIPGGLGQTARVGPSGQPSSGSTSSGSSSSGSNGSTIGAAGASGGAVGASGNRAPVPTVVLAASAVALSGSGAGLSGSEIDSSGSGITLAGGTPPADATITDGIALQQTATAAQTASAALTATTVASGVTGSTPSAASTTTTSGTPGTSSTTTTPVGSATATTPGPDASLTSTPTPTPTPTSGSGSTSFPPAPSDTFTPTPTDTPSLGPTDTPTLLPTDTATSGGGPNDTPTSTDTPSLGPTNTATSGGGPNNTPTPTMTSTPVGVPTPVGTLTSTPTATFTPTLAPTATFTFTATRTPTATATATNTATPTPTPSIVLQSGSITPQSPISVSGSRFGPNQTVSFTIDGTSLGTYGIASNCTTDSAGNFTCSFILPPLPAGKHAMTASDGTHSVSITFTVVPSLSLNPSQGFDGTGVTATGYGFGAGRNLTFTFSWQTISKNTAPGQCTSDTNGSFICGFHVPVGDSNSQAGIPYTVTASDGTNSATAIFMVYPK